MLCVRPCASHWVSESWEIWTTQTENKPGSYSPKASPFPQSSICSKYLWKWKCYLLSHVQLFVPLWTIASQAPLFMEFSRKECWDGLLFPSPWDLSKNQWAGACAPAADSRGQGGPNPTPQAPTLHRGRPPRQGCVPGTLSSPWTDLQGVLLLQLSGYIKL